MKQYKKNLGSRVLKLRKHAGLSQADFAKKIGAPQTTISNMERGSSAPSAFVINQIALAFPDVDLRWFVTGEGEMWGPPPPPEDEGARLAKKFRLGEIEALGRMGSLGYAWTAREELTRSYPAYSTEEELIRKSPDKKMDIQNGLRLLERMNKLEWDPSRPKFAFRVKDGGVDVKSEGVADINRHGLEGLRMLVEDIIPASERGTGGFFTCEIEVAAGARAFKRSLFETVSSMCSGEQVTNGEEVVTVLLGIDISDSV